jgi:hypothetical protein
MKSKFKDLIEAGIVTAPSAFGAKPISNKPVSSQTGAFGGGSTPANDVQPGERPNPFRPNPFTVTPTPAPVAPAPAPAPVAPAPVAPAPVQPKFNPVQPFGPVIPTVPSVQPGTEYTPTPGSVKPGSTPTTPAPAPVAPAPAPATPSTPKPSFLNRPRGTGKAKSQYEVNRAASDAEFQKFKAFQARKQERASILAQTRQAEAELADNEPQTRTRGGGTGRGTGTSGRRIFENNTRMQFKQGSLKSLLNEVSAFDLFNLSKYVAPYIAPVVNVVKKATDIGSDVVKYSTDPAYAAKTMIKYTTPTPGESKAIRTAKTLIGYSPDTIARMQARRGAAASAFDTATANEKLKHYEKMFAMSNPASLATSGIASAVGALAGAGAGDKMGIGGKLATGLAGTVKNIADYQTKAQAKEAARQQFARLDDWRVLTR